MNDFSYDIFQKKRIAAGARYRKRGSRSRKCTLPSDGMTQKQWKERCGSVMSYQLGRPMSWNQFKLLPQDIQKIYIDDLMEKFCPTATDISKVFGATAHTVTKYLGDRFGIKFSPGKKMPKDRADDFATFLYGTKTDDTPEETLPEVCVGTMSMTEFSLSFSGKLDPRMIHNSITSMLPEGKNVKIEIRCSICGQ